ncbi:MAG: dihydrolipoyl dehydrogenase [Chlamydiota bacterium]|nr:dihydrolipoyl dehydrogenase [Chlamydiota bacterium]
MTNKKYDVIVIGSGPGGYVAAIRAAQLGFKTACIEKYPTLGGTCLNVGCIPSKALLQSSEYYHLLKHDGKIHGIDCGEIKHNFKTMMNRKSHVVDGLTGSIALLFQKNKIDRIEGVATFLDPYSVEVKGEKITADHFILATGSKPIELPFLPFDEKKIVSSTGALALNKVPKKMLVIGAGVIGVELASVYSRLGSKVTIVEMLDRVCPGMDLTVCKSLQEIYTKQGLEFYLQGKVTSGEVTSKGVKITFTHESKEYVENVDVAMVSVGRRPYTEGLGLDKIGIETDERGFVPVNSQFRTRHAHILAIGDIIDGPMLAHKASEEGMAAAEVLAGHDTHVNYMAIPNVIYTHPEVASVGLTEQEAKDMGLKPKSGIFYFRNNPRARCSHDTDGLVKVIGDATSGRLIGMHIIGPHASELIGEGVMAIEKKATLEDLARASHAHPTLCEAIKDASLAALRRPIHG